jgi:hypothetical protein
MILAKTWIFNRDNLWDSTPRLSNTGNDKIARYIDMEICISGRKAISGNPERAVVATSQCNDVSPSFSYVIAVFVKHVLFKTGARTSIFDGFMN